MVEVRRGSTAGRRRLGIELRRLRIDAQLTIDQVATALGCSTARISRIENGQIVARGRDVREILQLYGAGSRKREELLQIADDVRGKGWHAYGDVPRSSLVRLEQEAASIRIYQTLLIPGLLQTKRYARSVLGALRPDLEPDEQERLVDLRMERQSLLAEEGRVRLWAVIDESALRRPVGGREIMREQLRHLVEATSTPTVRVQVLPFSVGAHAGMVDEFVILEFAEVTKPDVVYVQRILADSYLDRVEEVSLYVSIFDHLRTTALQAQDSINLIGRLVEES
jgi:transcriptional regulator with XRE-family HTH domain